MQKIRSINLQDQMLKEIITFPDTYDEDDEDNIIEQIIDSTKNR